MNIDTCQGCFNTPTSLTFFQVRKHFTVDEYSHYIFTPRDLTQWVLGLMRYPLSQDGGSQQSSHVLLEIWAYEACRLFRDKLVGEKSQKQFDDMLNTVIQSDWSVDLSQEGDGEARCAYVSWGVAGGKDTALSSRFGRPLGRLSGADMEEVVNKAVVAYGESIIMLLISAL